MAQRIQTRRGLKANLPNAGMLAGELHATTDRGTLHVATDPTTRLPVVPAIEDLAAMAAINGAEDLLIIHDASEVAGQQEKRVTVDALKGALNIPAGSTDEMVAAVSGGTSGYLYGADGTDGVLRMGNSLAMDLDASNGFVTLRVTTIDGGTF